MSDPSCRSIRELLGVYVVGAIEPAERSVVDRHLGDCHECLEELAGLAGLPALLRRVPLAEAEQLAGVSPLAGDHGDPQPELLASTLRRVVRRRRTRLVRAALATAAAVAVAASGGALINQALTPAPISGPTSVTDRAWAVGDGMTAMVRYGKGPWGTEMWVQATGIPLGTTCEFWVETSGGSRLLVGGWTVGPDAGRLWYPAATSALQASLTAFEITSNGKVLLRIPAPT
jgi:putative zinc finger protein